MKKLAGLVRFQFYKQKTEKTEPNRNRQKTGKKPSQTGKTEPIPEKTEKTEPNRSEPVFSLKKPNRTEPKLFVKKLIGLIGFFFRFGFFGYFFLGFLGLFGFSVFLITPNIKYQYPLSFFLVL